MSFFFEVVPSTGALGLVSLEEVPPCGQYGAIGVSRTRRTRIIDAGNFSRLYSIGFGVSSHSQSPKSEILATQLTNILGTFHPKAVHRVTNPNSHSPIRREIPAKTRQYRRTQKSIRTFLTRRTTRPVQRTKEGRAPSGTRPSIGVIRFARLTR